MPILNDLISQIENADFQQRNKREEKHDKQ